MKVKTLTELISSTKFIESIPYDLIPDINMHEYSIAPLIYYPEYIDTECKWALWGLYIDRILRRIIDRCILSTIEDYKCNDIIKGRTKNGNINNCDDIIAFIKISYERYINIKFSTKATLKDTWIITLAHSLWYSGFSRELWDVSVKFCLSSEELDILALRMKELIRGMSSILDITSSYRKTGDSVMDRSVKILTNPNLGLAEVIYAEADLIIGDCIIDFKCSKKDCVNTKNFIQIITYAALSRLQDHSTGKRIAILNPISGKLYIQDISSWNKDKEYIDFITKTIKIFKEAE